ncbi:MAG: hypothetical protein V1659_03030 [Candidatus Woesearchaeota archaeon]
MKQEVRRTLYIAVIIVIIVSLVLIAANIIKNQTKDRTKLPEISVNENKILVSECSTGDKESATCCYDDNVLKKCIVSDKPGQSLILKVNVRKVLESVGMNENVCILNYLKTTEMQVERPTVSCYPKSELLFLGELVFQGEIAGEDVLRITVSDRTVWEYE